MSSPDHLAEEPQTPPPQPFSPRGILKGRIEAVGALGMIVTIIILAAFFNHSLGPGSFFGRAFWIVSAVLFFCFIVFIGLIFLWALRSGWREGNRRYPSETRSDSDNGKKGGMAASKPEAKRSGTMTALLIILVVLLIAVGLAFLATHYLDPAGKWLENTQLLDNINIPIGTQPCPDAGPGTDLHYDSPLGTPPDVVRVVGYSETVRDDCFGRVVHLPRPGVNTSARSNWRDWCYQPYSPKGTIPPDWTITFEFVKIDSDGNAIPVAVRGPYHWSNPLQPEDKPNFWGLSNIYPFRLKGNAPDNDGISFYSTPPGTSCDPYDGN